jgi:hypothetical protein
MVVIAAATSADEAQHTITEPATVERRIPMSPLAAWLMAPTSSRSPV